MNDHQFEVDHYRCVFDGMRVTLSSIEEGEAPEQLLQLPTAVALAMARHLLARESAIMYLQAELTARFLSLSETFVALFLEEVKRSREGWLQTVGFVPSTDEFDTLIHRTYQRLKEQHNDRLPPWCRETQEYQFWQDFGTFLDQHYADRLRDMYSPAAEDGQEAHA